MDDHGEDAHLCRATVVEFDGALPELGLLVKGIPLLLEGVDERHVAGERSLLLFHHEELEEANEDDNLSDAKGTHLQ